tara:strand:+ start:31990 stop:32190 length:201 start_codon:yes stop_codon:yes gene_type:complete
MFFIDLFWTASTIFSIVSLFYRNKNEGIIFNFSPLIVFIFLTLLILYTPLEGKFIGNLEFIFGTNK